MPQFHSHLVEALARAGWEQNRRNAEECYGHIVGAPWEDETDQLRGFWRKTAIAMLEEFYRNE